MRSGIESVRPALHKRHVCSRSRYSYRWLERPIPRRKLHRHSERQTANRVAKGVPITVRSTNPKPAQGAAERCAQLSPLRAAPACRHAGNQSSVVPSKARNKCRSNTPSRQHLSFAPCRQRLLPGRVPIAIRNYIGAKGVSDRLSGTP